MESPYQDMSKKEILEDYTEYDRLIREHMGNFPEFPDTAHTLYAVYWTNHVEKWFEQLKIIVGSKQ